MVTQTVTIPFSQIAIQQGLIESGKWTQYFDQNCKKCVIVTDHNVRKLLGHALKKALSERGIAPHLFSLPPGEKSKTRRCKNTIENKMLKTGLGRDVTLIALGGGVVIDLAGFVAATYCRGIPFVSIPTTLLAQVDASIGGKVGVNAPQGKNLIGAFYHPQSILIDPDVIKTLSPTEWRNGYAEMIKYGAIFSKSLFEKLEKLTPAPEMIGECCFIKKEIVEKDPKESGLRRVLNFGHTVGHALEHLTAYQMSHGEAIGLGMLMEAYMSALLGFLKEKDLFQIENLLKKYKFPLQLPEQINASACWQAMCLDKKSIGRKPRFVVLQEIGKTAPLEGNYCQTLEPKLLEETFRWQRLK